MSTSKGRRAQALPEASITERTVPVKGILDAVDRMSIADGQRLLRIARTLCYGTGMDGDDLFQEAVERTLAGRRLCPHDVDLMRFLAGVIRSVADAERKKRTRECAQHWGNAIDTIEATDATEVDANMVAEERRSECKSMVDAVFGLLDNDEEAQLLLMADFDGLSAAEIRDLNGLDKTALATVRRRIRRRIDRAYPKGWTR